MISIEEPKQPLGIFWWLLLVIAGFFSVLIVAFFVIDITGITLPGVIEEWVSTAGQFLRAV